jgi:hypothetical protein
VRVFLDRNLNANKVANRHEKPKNMKTKIYNVGSILTLVAFLLTPFAGRTEDFAKNYGLKFNCIGFYVTIDGVPNALQWTKNTTSQAIESDIIQIPPDAQFYSYGLDFSVGGMTGPQPPNLLGYGLSYMDTNGSLQGAWAARFVPVAGYDQKVYRIVFEGPYDDLRNDKVQYRFWAFDVPGNNQGFLFHFNTVKFAEEQKEQHDFISKTLSNKDKIYNGKLTVSMPGATLQVIPFQIQFTSYDEKTGKVDAEVSGLNGNEKVKFTGQLVNIRELTLKKVEGDNSLDSVWNLQLLGQNKLIATYANGINSVKVEITLLDTPSE